uniref:T-complex protein 11 n=1 Tax=Solanum lycopersicum TaxID=4081 RepID=A0A3Q7GYK2_SOLLC
MEMGIESATPKSDHVAGMALNIPVNDSNYATALFLPRRLRRRLLETKTPSIITAQDIETKLKDAELRRQDGELRKQLEAKLLAAEKKRLSILAKVQKRLARLDELRQAAKNAVEMRFEKERDELGNKVESRAQRAELNRRVLLKCRQWKAAKRERISQLLTRRVMQESKYRECVGAAIHRKRAAAEKKRLGFLEAERSKARARIVQVKQIANSVYRQREIERIRLKDQLENRLQKAKRLRAEYLKQRRSLLCSRRSCSDIIAWGEFLSFNVARCWRRFIQLRRTTFSLAKAYMTLDINKKSVEGMPFEQLAVKMGSSATIQNAKKLLDRLEYRISIRHELLGPRDVLCFENINHLLERAASSVPARGEVAAPVKLSRYPFELLLKIIVGGSIKSTEEETPVRLAFGSQLKAFDKAWCSYLFHFVMWKVKDVKLLEEDLINTACQLELSLMQTCKQVMGDYDDLTAEFSSFQRQVIENQKLIWAKVKQLSGNAGLERLEHALSELRSRFIDSMETDSPSSVGSSDNSEIKNSDEFNENARCYGTQGIAWPVSVEDDSYLCDKCGSGTPQKSISTGLLRATENEVLLNEIVHKGCGLEIVSEEKESDKARVKERMEEAFWDGVMQSLSQDNPDFSWVLKLMKEVQNELCEMSPPSWRQEIVETVDINILSQVLNSGTLDMDYFGRILEFALVTLRKLSAPLVEDELNTNHQKFLKELGENTRGRENSTALFASLVIKGLQFVLRQIKKLKGEISKARIKLLEPLIKGPAGFEYLRSSFSNRYGPPTEALISLPLVKQWLSSVMLVAVQEWDDHLSSLSSLRLSSGAHSSEKAPITLRAGGSSLRISDPPTLKTNAEQPECKGDKVDLFLRLGLLQLVCEIEGLTVETLPETLKLNFSRLRAVQAILQKIIVVCTSILVLRQTLLAECLVSSPSEMEDISSKSITKLFKLLDNMEDAGITEVVDTLSLCLEGDEPKKLQARKEIMANVLAKSLRAGDAIFTRVSRTVFLAAKAILLCGSVAEGGQLAENTLKRVGANLLTGKLVEAMKDLLVVATVSARVHGSWYVEVLKNMRAL